MDEADLLRRITVNPEIFGGKPIVGGRRLAVQHVPGMLAAGDTPEIILEGYPWLEREDIRACLIYARRLVGHEYQTHKSRPGTRRPCANDCTWLSACAMSADMSCGPGSSVASRSARSTRKTSRDTCDPPGASAPSSFRYRLVYSGSRATV